MEALLNRDVQRDLVLELLDHGINLGLGLQHPFGRALDAYLGGVRVFGDVDVDPHLLYPIAMHCNS
jgi:hypothetical protein